MNKILNIGDVVALQNDEVGVIQYINDKMLWGFNYSVILIKNCILHESGEVIKCRKEDMTYIKSLSSL